MASILSDSTGSEQQQDVSEIIKQAYVFLISKREQQAIQIYTKCIKDHPTCWRAYQNLGVAYIMIKDFQKAYQMLKKYVQHVPKDPLGHDSLGVSYSQLNDPLQAVASFVNAINLSPNYYMPYYNLGVVLGKLGLYDYALNVYQRCLELQPSYVNAMNNIGDIFKRYNDIDSAINIFKEILQLQPQYSLAMKNLGNCYFVKKDFYNALISYLSFLDLNQNNQSVTINTAICLDHFGMYYEAGHLALNSYKLVTENGGQGDISKVFIAGNLLCRQMHKINRLMRTALKFRKFLKRQLRSKFFNSYKQTLQCFNYACEIYPNSIQSRQNLQRARSNLIGYFAKLGKAYSISYTISGQFNENINLEGRKLLKQIQKSRLIQIQIKQWRRYLKRLVTSIQKKDISPNRKKFLQQKQHVYVQIFERQKYQVNQQQYKVKTYISRRHRHNLNRLIMSRYKFIKKFNKFNCEFQKKFKYKPMLSTMSLSKNLEQENRNEMNQMDKEDSQ